MGLAQGDPVRPQRTVWSSLVPMERPCAVWGPRLSLGEHYMDGFAGQDMILRTPGFEYYQSPCRMPLPLGPR